MAKTKNQASLEAGLWNACNKLRGSVSATDYVNVVLGLLFLRFAYDKFNAQREKLLADEDTADFVENPRFYSKDNVFFLDENDRWSYIKDNSKSNKIFTYIDDAFRSDQIGKGAFAYALAETITDDFVVPDYISNAVLWACGGKSL